MTRDRQMDVDRPPDVNSSLRVASKSWKSHERGITSAVF
ncbi:hypothetical protein BRPE64_ECDS00460 (plasmid) [Caballeronia insecticola]|uniref:Uncharacterized protein n=1 Tax=Caballeronia insecticola TaxID=758793 RepID=R4WUH2_9BURK|nr:hypothetical protein BRPE64_ECDS00460 [Caballeronia insecticola]